MEWAKNTGGGRRGAVGCVIGAALGMAVCAVLLLAAAGLAGSGALPQESWKLAGVISACVGGLCAGIFAGGRNKEFALGSGLITGGLIAAVCLLLSAAMERDGTSAGFGIGAILGFLGGSAAGSLLRRKKVHRRIKRN